MHARAHTHTHTLSLSLSVAIVMHRLALNTVTDPEFNNYQNLITQPNEFPTPSIYQSN